MDVLSITRRGSTWQFYRRVPVKYKEFDSRRCVQTSLKTKCKKEAIRLAGVENTKLIEYWESLAATGTKHAHDTYTQAVKRSSVLGFTYTPKLELAKGALEELLERLTFVFEKKFNAKTTEAVLGTVPEPEILFSDLLPKFLGYRKDVKLQKSDRQYKRWENPRKMAMRYFIEVVGDKPVQKLTREDMLKFKDWWTKRITVEKLSVAHANQVMDQVKNIIETVCDNLKIRIDAEHIFKKLFFKKERKRRATFTTEHIVNVLLNQEKLSGMTDHYQKILGIFAETGAHLAEIVSILPENIHLDHKIPHVIIMSYEKNQLKTAHRERVMPLVGYALDGFRAYPKGFSHLIKNVDSAGAAIVKYLRENDMLPTKKHTPYSLRHSFQDRLTNKGIIDRVQTDLMGHSFGDRVTYGDGSWLATKHQALKKIQLKPK